MASQDHVIREQITQLDTLDRSGLVDKWIKAYGAPPFKGARRQTLVRGLACHMQSKRLGSLKPSISRRLLKIAKANVTVMNKPPSKPTPKTKLGSQIIREWNGRTHTVHVTDKGFVMSGVTYGSLSAAAKAITGSHWSGPRFFGVAS